MSKTIQMTPKLAKAIFDNVTPGPQKYEDNFSQALRGDKIQEEVYRSIPATQLAEIVGMPKASAAELHLATRPYSRGFKADNPNEPATVQVYMNRLYDKMEGKEPTIPKEEQRIR